MRRIYLLLAAIAICAAAYAAGAEPRRDLQIRTGGIGVEERAAFDADRAVYYEGRTEGPLLFARLEPGPYRLKARYEGRVQVRDLNVGENQAQPYLYLRWPQGEARARAGG